MTTFNFMGRKFMYPCAAFSIAFGAFCLVEYYVGWNVFHNPDPREFPLIAAIFGGLGLFAYAVGKATTVRISSDGIGYGIYPLIRCIPLSDIEEVIGQPGPDEASRESSGRVRFLKILTRSGRRREIPLPFSYRDKLLAAIQAATSPQME